MNSERIEGVMFWIAHEANINWIDDKGKSPLHISIERGNLEISQFLILNGASVDLLDKEGKSPLYYARQTRQLVLIQIFAN